MTNIKKPRPLPLPVNKKGESCCPKCAYPENLAGRWDACGVEECPIKFARSLGIPLAAQADWSVDDAVGEFNAKS